MASTIGVTSAPSVPFRRFLPHEKPVTPPVRHRDFHAVEAVSNDDDQHSDKMPFAILSDQDIGVLMGERLGISHETPDIYLPLEFALAAER